MTFSECVVHCFEEKEFVSNWERLYGLKISDWRPPRNGIEAMVDKASGHVPTVNEEAARAFTRFVWNYVWTRLPEEAFVK